MSTHIARRNLLAAGAGLALTSPLATAARARQPLLKLDVAVNGTTFAFTGPTNEDGQPIHGAPFVIKGAIYPEGTLAEADPVAGLTGDGAPQFPDAQIGSWMCSGWLINDGLATKRGAHVTSTQLFDLGPDEPGKETVLSEGIEVVDVGVPIRRAIIGGSGKYAGARGEVVQVKLGTNATEAPNLQFAFIPQEAW